MWHPRFSLRRLLFLVAALAVILGLLAGLQRRRERFQRLAAEYTSAIRCVYSADLPGRSGESLSVEAAEYHNDLVSYFRTAAARPWLPLPPLPSPPSEGLRAFWIAHAEVKRTHPGINLEDYVAMITLDDMDAPPDQRLWAVAYKRRDQSSGMNVYLEDPIRIESWTAKTRAPGPD